MKLRLTMIKIELDDATREKIETRHWEWYENYIQKKEIPLKSGKTSVQSFLENELGWNKETLRKITLAKDVKNKSHSCIHECADESNQIRKDYLSKKDSEYEIKKEGWTSSRKWKVRQILEEYFGYEDFSKGAFQDKAKETWNAYAFIQALNIDVCPYCNRQYIFTIRKGNGRPQIDHFYPQEEYPYLSCSLYNFIPSCAQCNHQKSSILNKKTDPSAQNKHTNFRWKNDFAFTLYPYTEAFEETNSCNQTEKNARFRVRYSRGQENEEYNSSLDDMVIGDITIKKPALKDKITNSIEAFHLKELYSCHKLDLKDLFTRYRNYSKPKIDEITRLIVDAQLDTKKIEDKSPLKHFKLTKEQKEELVQQVASTYTKRIKRTILGLPLGAGEKQYPLRKFKEDIIEQLDNTAQKMKTEARNKNISK